LAVELLLPSVQVAVPVDELTVHVPPVVPVVRWNEFPEQLSVVPAFCTGT
jgi:hypothetical protein